MLRCCFAALLPLVIAATLRAAPSPIGTGLKSNITLGALQTPAAVNQEWPDLIDYDVNPGSWTYDVYVPPDYDGTKPYGVVVYITSDNNTGGDVLQAASNDKNLIWISPRNIGNADGDGLTNTQEFATGTDPTNAASVLKVTSLVVSGSDFVVSFPTVSGKTYRVERSDTLQAGSWTTLLDNITGTGGVLQVTDPNGALQTKRFYKLVLQ